ncbi:TetR/AcrR family transcriptional regulator [Brevundimonas sp.]|uniref:TetR/AcrR family transcriptional regulator n=1 Tax=Brevundimonas sp. TaxID=1871086 RepID=UPI00356A4A0C
MTTARPDTDASRSPRRAARQPVRERGIQRQALLLDAVDDLLRSADPEDVGIYQIAERAKVAPASVYHFFPTREAAFVALAQRYLAEFRRLGEQPAEASRLKSWQDYFEIEQARVSAAFNDSPPALRIFLGYAGAAVRNFGARFNTEMTTGVFDALDRLFHMPHVADPQRRFGIAHAVMEAVWTQAYLQDGRITEECRQDALEAHRVYCRLFLPERVEPRDWVRTAAERGEAIGFLRAPDTAKPSAL